MILINDIDSLYSKIFQAYICYNFDSGLHLMKIKIEYQITSITQGFHIQNSQTYIIIIHTYVLMLI